MKGLIGKKVGMTNIFSEEGESIPVTVVEAGPCVVLSYKKIDNKYGKLLLGYERANPPKKKGDKKKAKDKLKGAKTLNKPKMGLFDKIQTDPLSKLKEFRVDKKEDFEPGKIIKIEEVFEEGQKVDVRSKTKGRGFTGVIKRHGFHGGKGSHGSMFHRAPGSIGQGTTPGRVIKGHPLPGQYGSKYRTIQNIKIVKMIPEKNLLLLKGSIPGPNGSYLRVQNAMKNRGREHGR